MTSLLCAPFIVTPSRSAARRIVIRDSGGIFTNIYADVLYKPFRQATGIEIASVTSGAELITPIRTMVETGRYLWDAAEGISDMAILLLTTGNVYLEKHELDHDSVISSIPPQFRSPYGVGSQVYSTVLAYRTDVFKKRREPESWQALWNVEQFPGRRSLRKPPPFETIEIALMANGVPPSNLYPCDLDRAFRSLDKIKPHIATWWTTGPQTEYLLKSNEIDLMPSFMTRARSAIDAGAPVSFSWNQHIYGCGNWTILKGTPNADACREFIQFASDPKRQALLAPYGIGATHPDAFKYIDPKHAPLLPTYPDNLKKGLFIDAAYWAKHQQAALERFNDWIFKE